MKTTPSALIFLVTIALCSGVAFSQATPSTAPAPAPKSASTAKAAQYLPLPDGSFIALREGESAALAWERAQRMYPEAFGIQPQTSEGSLYDVDYFSSCVLKELDKAKTDFAVGQMREACKHKATPKICRTAAAPNERARCVRSCKEASYLSKSAGDCSRG